MPSADLSNAPGWGRLYLVWFAPTHREFRFPELESVADLLQIRFELVPLATLFAHRDDVDKALLHDAPPPPLRRSFQILRLDNDDAARRLAARCTSIKTLWELWGCWILPTLDKATISSSRRLAAERVREHGLMADPAEAIFTEMIQDVRQRTASTHAPWTGIVAPTQLQKGVTIHPYRKYDNSKVHRFIVELAAALDIDADVSMTSPDVEWCYAEEWTEPRHAPGKGEETLAMVSLYASYLGRLVATGQGRALADRLDVKKRNFIGNTSMEAEMSLIMANMAQAGPSRIAYDPFVGTASLLYAAASFGSYCLGSDIDGRMMRAKPGKIGAGKSWPDGDPNADKYPNGVYRAAAQYGLSHLVLDTLAFDFNQAPWRFAPTRGLFDAIVADPPYGIRAGAKRWGKKESKVLRDEPYIMPDGRPAHEHHGYRPPTRSYPLSELVSDLVSFSAATLAPGGRLVFWLPTVNVDDFGCEADEEEGVEAEAPREGGAREVTLPHHPMMSLVAHSMQDYGTWGRRLITMRKLTSDEIARGATGSQAETLAAPEAHRHSAGPPQREAADALHRHVINGSRQKREAKAARKKAAREKRPVESTMQQLSLNGDEA